MSNNIKPETKKKNTFWTKLSKWYSVSTFRHWTAFVIISLIAIAFIFLSLIIPPSIKIFDPITKQITEHEILWHHFFRDIGIALLPIGIMSLVYEYVLRQNFLDNMKKTIERTIEEKMPPRYKHMRDSGLVDIYPDLKIDKLKDDMRWSYNYEFRILDIWVENLGHLENILLYAILHKKCRVRVLLWDLKQDDVLKRRASALGNGRDVRFIMEQICANLRILSNLMDKIAKEPITNNTGSIEIQLYTSFIGVSFIGYGDVFFIGHFLRERMSSMGTQLKLTGHHHFFYQELDKHFESQWSDPTNIKFTTELYKEYKKWLDKYISDNPSKD